MGEYIEQVIRPEFSDIDLHIKVTSQDDVLRVINPVYLSYRKQLGEFIGRKKVLEDLFDFMIKDKKFIPQHSKLMTIEIEEPSNLLNFMKYMINVQNVLQSETPSVFSSASARGMARLAAYMANEGSLEGKTFLEGKGWEALHADPITRGIFSGHTRCNFTQGGINQFTMHNNNFKEDDLANSQFGISSERKMNQNRDGFWGWQGYGGSIMQWHPELKIGFGYVPYELFSLDLANKRGSFIQKAVMDVVRSNQ